MSYLEHTLGADSSDLKRRQHVLAALPRFFEFVFSATEEVKRESANAHAFAC